MSQEYCIYCQDQDDLQHKVKVGSIVRDCWSEQREREKYLRQHETRLHRLSSRRVTYKETGISWTTAVTMTPDQRLILKTTGKPWMSLQTKWDSTQPRRLQETREQSQQHHRRRYCDIYDGQIQPGPHNLMYSLLIVYNSSTDLIEEHISNEWGTYCVPNVASTGIIKYCHDPG